MDSPCPAFVRSRREEGLEPEKVVGSLYQTHRSGLFEPHLGEECLPVVIVLEFGDFGFRPCRDYENFGILVGYGLSYGFHVCVSVRCGGVVDVADVHHRLVGEQEEVPCHRGFLFICRYHGPA